MENRFGVALVGLNGELLPSFDVDGTKEIEFSLGSFGSGGQWAYTVGVDGLQRIVIGGYVYYNTQIASYLVALARVFPSGALDTSFSNDGLLTIDFPDVVDTDPITIDVKPSGAIVVAGTSDAGTVGHHLYPVVKVASLLSSGTLNTAFSGDGMTTFMDKAHQALGSMDTYGVMFDRLGRVVTAGLVAP